jgi:hypothetical protein
VDRLSRRLVLLEESDVPSLSRQQQRGVETGRAAADDHHVVHVRSADALTHGSKR